MTMNLTGERTAAPQPATRRGRPSKDGPGPRADRRDAIIKASTDLFLRNGYARTTLRRIAAAAHVDMALTHYYFVSKQGLYQDVLETALGETFAALRQSRQSLPAVGELVQVLSAPLIAEPLLGRALLTTDAPPDAAETAAAIRGRIRCHLAAILSAMQRTGRVRADLDTELLTATCLDLAWVPLRRALEKPARGEAPDLAPAEKLIAQNALILEAAAAPPAALITLK